MDRDGEKSGRTPELVLIETGARPKRRRWSEPVTPNQPNFRLIDCRLNLFDALKARRRVPLRERADRLVTRLAALLFAKVRR